MHALTLRTVLLSSVMLLAACSSPQPRTEVTRFHLGTPIPPEAILVKAAAGQSNASVEFLTYKRYVSEELAGLGFSPIADGEAHDLIAEVAVDRRLQLQAPKRSGMSVGIGGGTRGSRIGIGGGVNFPLGRKSESEVFITELKVTLIRLSTKAVLWEGTATRQTPTSPESPAGVTRQLARDLFADFPGESGKMTVSEPTEAE